MERPKLHSYGSSKLVPCVQELAKQPMVAPPPRYIRPDQDPPNLTLAQRVPVIDMNKLVCGDQVELDRMHLACKEWGFFQLVNHGVDTTLLEKTKLEIRAFFELPAEKKKKFWQLENEVEGFGQAFVLSDEQKLDWADIFFMTTFPIRERKPHLFPKLPTPFRDTLEAYSLELKHLVITILGMMEKALGVEAKEMINLFDDGMQSLRMNYYPPCPQPENVIGLTPHSDSVGLTILLQLNEIDGLQIRKDDMWIPIKPLSNAFVVNVGDILEIVTNGIYRSIEHRATINKDKERLSVAAFHSTRFDAEIEPAQSLVTPHRPALFKKITMGDYLNGLFTRELGGKSYLDVMKIENEKIDSN